MGFVNPWLHTLSRSSLNSFYWRWVRRRWWHFGDGLEWSWICRSCKTTLWWWWSDRRSGHWSRPWWFRRTLSRFLLFDAFIQTQTLKWKKSKNHVIFLFTYTAGNGTTASKQTFCDSVSSSTSDFLFSSSFSSDASPHFCCCCWRYFARLFLNQT